MNEFSALRARARERRDAAIKQARTEYAESLNQIAALEDRLLQQARPKFRRVTDCIARVIPSDKHFTIDDIMEALEAMDPARNWHRPVVTSHITHLRNRGVLYRVRKPKMGTNAIYARKGVPAPPSAFGDKPLHKVMRLLLKKPMTAAELTVAVIEAGYETSMSRQNLRVTINRALRKGKFERDGERWRLG